MNGSTASPARVESLSLILLQGGMKELKRLKNPGATFSFSGIARPRGPLLLRAIYKKQPYVLMIPPAPRFWNRNQRLIVYDMRPLGKKSSITPALQITKLKEGLRVTKIFAVRNPSRYAIDPALLRIYIPSAASGIRARLEHESTRMPTPIQLKKLGAESYGLERSFRPGSSALSVDYTISGRTLQDRWPVGLRGHPSLPSRTMLVWWEPTDAVPQVSGGKATTVNTGKLGKALQVTYRAGQPVVFGMQAGSVAKPSRRRQAGPAVRGHATPIFSQGWITLTGLSIFVLIFFTVVALLASSGLRFVRKRDTVQ